MAHLGAGEDDLPSPPFLRPPSAVIHPPSSIHSRSPERIRNRSFSFLFFRRKRLYLFGETHRVIRVLSSLLPRPFLSYPDPIRHRRSFHPMDSLYTTLMSSAFFHTSKPISLLVDLSLFPSVESPHRQTHPFYRVIFLHRELSRDRVDRVGGRWDASGTRVGHGWDTTEFRHFATRLLLYKGEVWCINSYPTWIALPSVGPKIMEEEDVYV